MRAVRQTFPETTLNKRWRQRCLHLASASLWLGLQGDTVTKGLKKVTADMKTKNRADRTGVVSTSAGRVLSPAKLLLSYSKQIILYFRAFMSLLHVVMQSSLGCAVLQHASPIFLSCIRPPSLIFL